MTKEEAKTLACRISALSVFRGILDTDVMEALSELLSCDGDVRTRMSLYGRFVYALGEYGYSFSDFLRRSVYEDENKYVISVAEGKKLSQALAENTEADLRLLSKLTRIMPEDFREYLGYDGYIPQYENREADFVREYAERMADIGRCGYGIFAGAGMFRVESRPHGGCDIVPVDAADSVTKDDFVGYDAERAQVFDNTRTLIDGGPAANVLLFGDAGTGKSSTVKACANYFYHEGVRLIELRRDQILSLSCVMGRIAKNPLKFIIFIDDLSFNKNDDSFSMLKAALEGSASAVAKNAVIYATSNRRHIVKESFSDRADDDVHHGDTVQELMSLSDRFGLIVYFQRPDKRLYLEIVHALAERAGVKLPQGELDIKAEAFALAKGSRSPRAAEQFIDSLRIGTQEHG